VKIITQQIKWVFLAFGLVCYITFIISQFSYARPMGADVTNLSTETYVFTPESRQDLGGTIATITLSSAQQNPAWKAYVGNITGTLVLKNTDGYSIFEWSVNASTMGGYVFVSRNGTLAWANIACADTSVVDAEQAFLGMVTADSSSINKTFNFSAHDSMSISSVGTIANSTCPSMATYVNGTAQTINEDAYFQEILLSSNSNLVYATFINQNAWGFDNNASVGDSLYDFQLIVAENESTTVGTTYYFYAEITS
jgi:hypothetical protein